MNTTRRARSVLTMLGLLLLAGSTTRALAAGSAVQVSHGPRTANEVALTFDDGSSPANCRRILAELVTAGVPATFFPIAEAMQLDPGFWQLVAEVGDPIGDHTLTHPQMPTLGYSAQVHQLAASRAIVESIIGRPMLNVFRPPYGAWNGTTLAAAAATGFSTVITWDTSDRDTSPQGTLKEMLEAADQGTKGSVILMHCGPNATPYLVPSIIDHYRARGYRFVTIPQMLGVPWTPGPETAVTAETFLGSLTPLPDVPKGGPIVGGAGWTGPIPTPTPKPSAVPTGTPSASPGTPAPTMSASPSAPTPRPTSSVAPTPAAPRATDSASALAAVPASTAPPGRPSTGSGANGPSAAAGDPIGIAAGVAVLAAAALVLCGVLVARRRAPRDRSD